jgi:Arc/MetJ-type ribon-helix-helix transcriptional regulator
MNIHLPNDLESSLRAAVRSGRFTSLDEAMTAAARMLLGEWKPEPPTSDLDCLDDGHDRPIDPILGCMRGDADLMDEIVADAYRHRREETWREVDL